MKSKFAPLYALFLLTFFLVSNSSNPPDGRTGAPGDGNCNNCHTGNNVNNFEGTLEIQGLPEQITPNANYTVKVVAKKTGGDPVRAGFQMVILDDNNQNTGTFSNPGDNAVLKEDQGRNYFEHNPAQRFEDQEEVSWTVDWTAPAEANTGINIYANSIFGNGSGTSGDLQIATTMSSVVVNSSEPIVASIIERTDVSCFGGTDGRATVSITGGTEPYNYEWSNGSMEASVNNLPKGTHSVSITDAAGMTDTIEVMIEEPTPIVIEVISQVNIDCMNPIGLVEVVASGGTPIYEYVWDDISGAAVSLPVGDHEVTVTDGLGCTQTASVTIDKNVLLPQVNAGSNKALDCKEAFVSLEGRADEGPSISYLWTTTDGSILTGATSLEPIVEAKGIYTLLVSDATTGCSASSQVEVTEDFETPIANAGTTKQLDCAEPFITLDGSVDSERNTLSFQWTNENGTMLSQAISLTPTVSEIGTYTLIVTDTENGCSSSSSVSVIPDVAAPMAFAGEAQQLDCETNQLMLNGNGSTGIDYIYNWETEDGRIESGETTLNPVVSEGGTYTLTVRNRINGCDANSSVTISDNAVIEANAGGDIALTCSSGPTATLNGSTSTRGENITYEWTTEDGNIVGDNTSFIVNIDGVGVYTLTVRDIDSGCAATDQITVTQTELVPQIDAPAIQELTCDSPTIQLEATTLESPEIVYQWITEDGHIVGNERTLNPLVDAPGTYNLGVINTVSGCVNTATIEVIVSEDLPSVLVNPSAEQLDCITMSIVLDGSGSTNGANIFYEWSTEDGNIVEGRTNHTATINAGGQYRLVVTNTTTGCSSSYTTDIKEIDFPSEITFDTPPVLDCTNNLVRLSAMTTVDNLSYQWSTADGNIVAGSTTLAPLVDAPGAYTLTVFNDGCSLVETINIIEEARLEVQVETPDVLDCNNPTVDLNVLGNTSQLDFLWSTVDGNIVSGEGTDRISVGAAGTYEVLVIDPSNGCSGASVFEVQDQRLFIILDTIIGNSATVLVDGGVMPYAYEWSTNPIQTSVTANDLEDGTYTVTITDAVGCTISATSVIDMSTSVSDINSLVTYDLFPNPTNNILTIEANFNQWEEGVVNVLNVLGKRKWQQPFRTKELQLVIDVAGWESGVYFIQLETMEGVRVKQVVVGN